MLLIYANISQRNAGGRMVVAFHDVHQGHVVVFVVDKGVVAPRLAQGVHGNRIGDANCLCCPAQNLSGLPFGKLISFAGDKQRFLQRLNTAVGQVELQCCLCSIGNVDVFDLPCLLLHNTVDSITKLFAIVDIFDSEFEQVAAA